MKTDDLIGLLAREAGPVPAHAGERRFAIALTIGIALSLAWVQGVFGVRADLPHVMATLDFWQKIAMPLAVTGMGVIVVFRLAHPGLRMRGWWLGLWLPVALLWIVAAGVLWTAEPPARMPLLLGTTWRSCVFNVTATALPIGAALLWALRGLAPTRPVATGAAAGWLAGAAGACVYSLHCPEMALPFVGVWYVLGMGVSAALGALVGRHWLRW